MLCPTCQINSARIDKQLGCLPCKECQTRHSQIKGPDKQVEFTSDDIREGRRKHFKSIIQPWRDDQPSKEYADAYPERAKKMFTKYKKSQIKNVWSDITPMGGIERTK